MDVVDRALYACDIEIDAEITRQAYQRLFCEDSQDALIVMRHLVGICRYEDEMDYNDPVINAKWNSLHGVIRQIKKQLNLKKIEITEGVDDE